jgi:tryptophanyl-tRNA synthetase
MMVNLDIRRSIGYTNIMSKPRIFSGIQPSGNLHIGNYLGAIKNWVKLQHEYDSIFCVVDLHAITVPQDPEKLKKNILEVARVFLASGLDPEKCSLFIQSHVHEHSELMWILNTIIKIPELNRMTQFKDKSNMSDMSSTSAGLLNYPVLMAADILLYDTNLVPVGEDQVQHVEITRTLGKRFNSQFGETFVLPESFVQKEGKRIMGLDDPTKKMSKSAASEYNYISLTDDKETVRRNINKAVTDSGSEIIYSDDKPALKNLINIYSLFSDKKPEKIQENYKGKGYADFKNDLAEEIIKFLKPFQIKMAEYSDEKVLEILRAGAEKVRPLAEKKISEVKQKLGFVI